MRHFLEERPRQLRGMEPEDSSIPFPTGNASQAAGKEVRRPSMRHSPFPGSIPQGECGPHEGNVLLRAFSRRSPLSRAIPVGNAGRRMGNGLFPFLLWCLHVAEARTSRATALGDDPRREIATPAMGRTRSWRFLPGDREQSGCLRRRALHRPDRIPVWLLVQARKLGSSEAELLRAYPSLRAEDLANAWSYYRGHREEVEQQIQENEAA